MIFSSVNSISGFCVMQLDEDIPTIATIIETLEETSDQFIKSTLSVSSGKDIFSQVLTSITTTTDIIILGFMASSVVGVLVLLLFSQEIFISFVAYTLVLSIDAALLIGAYIVQNLYLKQVVV